MKGWGKEYKQLSVKFLCLECQIKAVDLAAFVTKQLIKTSILPIKIIKDLT